MTLTTGTLMFYGGIGGAVTLTILLIATFPFFRSQRKKMKKEISRKD
jgi:hypothetical protein